MNSFLASGGDNFLTLAQGTNRADTGRIDLQSMVDYFEEFPVATPDYAQRSVGATLSPADADGYSADDQVTLDLSSLLLSGSGPAAGTAVVSLGGTELGSAAIDPTVVDTTDEVGRATVVFTVPAGAVGPQVLTVTVPENGTSIDVPIVFAEAATKVDSRIYTSVNRSIVFGNQRITFTTRVVADGAVPTGRIGIYDGTRRIATAVLEADDAGRVSVVLPRLSTGVHLLTARYSGSDEVRGSRSGPRAVLVF